MALQGPPEPTVFSPPGALGGGLFSTVVGGLGSLMNTQAAPAAGRPDGTGPL